MARVSCPTDEELRRTLTANETDGIDHRLQTHLDACERCQERLERLAGESIAGETLREALVATPSPSSKLLATIDRLSTRAAASGSAGPPRYDDLERWIESSSPEGTETLDGYVLLACIGRGGMGVVFRAIDPASGDEVAVKAMLPELARDPQARERFLREARAMAAVRHPNVVALQTVSEVSGLPYLVTEYVEGESLQDRMQNATPFAPPEIKRIGAEVAAGLAACHEQGVVHRDIKPSNVLLHATDGAVKITDFGLAAVTSTPTLTYHGYLSGTPDYVAPERLTIGSKADERGDLFSLGCLLYAMAAGEPPFGGDTPLIILHRIASEQPPRVGVKNPKIPPPLEYAITALMAKKPEDRPESAHSARRLLLEGPLAEQPFAYKRSRWMTGGFLFTALVIAAVYLLWPAADPPPSASTDLHLGTTEVDEAIAAVEAESVAVGTMMVKTAEALEAAIDAVPNGGRIEIDSDDVLVVSPLYVEFKSITLAAAEGRTPTLQLRLPDEGSAPDYLLRMYYGTLRLDGVRLRDTWTPDEHLRRVDDFQTVAEQYGLVNLIDADFHATRCRFETRTVGSAVKLDPGNEAVLIDCEVLAPSGSAVNWHAIDGDELRLEDCVLAGNVGLLVDVEGNAETSWQGTVAIAQIAVFEMKWTRGQLAARISDCVLQSVEAMVLTSLDPPSLSGLKRSLAWYGLNNRIRGQEVVFLDGEYHPSWASPVTAWAIEDPGSTYGRTSFRFGHQEVITRLLAGEPIESLRVAETSR